MAIRIVIKVGDQSSDYTGFRDGMIVCILVPSDLVSDHMKKVFAIVDVPDEWASELEIALGTYNMPEDDPELIVLTGTPVDARMRCRHVDLTQLATSLGDVTLVSDWRDVTVVPIQDGSGLDVSELQDCVGYDFPDVPDNNLIFSGAHTVGSGGSYTTWSAAFADLGSPLTGNLTLTQITSTTESANSLFNNFDYAGNTLELRSGTPHFGSPIAGHEINLAFSTTATFGSAMVIRPNVTQAAGSVLIVRNLRYRATVAPSFSQGTLFVRSVLNVLTQIHDIMIDGSLLRGGFSTQGTGVAEVWNIQVWECSPGVGFKMTGWGGTSYKAENLKAHKCETGITYSDNATIEMRNIWASDSTFNDWLSSGSLPTRESLASSDLTAGGTNAKTSVVTADEVVSLLDSSPDFLKLKASVGDDLDVDGATPTISGNTKGIRNNTRPGPGGFTSIGADESDAEGVTVRPSTQVVIHA